MKKWMVLVLLVFMSGCAITTVEYRYKQRFDHFYKLLNEEEKKAFCSDDFGRLAALLQKRMAEDTALSNEMDRVMFDEAIHTFRMDQVGMFFKRYILTGFHQDDYEKWVTMLPSGMLLKFAYQDSSLVKDVESLVQKDGHFASWWKKLATDGRLGDFSAEQKIAFYRKYIFVERTQREVYSLAKFLSDYRLLGRFLRGDGDFGNRLDEVLKKDIVARRELKNLKMRAGLAKLSDGEFFAVYRDVVFKEMDQEALAKTLAKFSVEK